MSPTPSDFGTLKVQVRLPHIRADKFDLRSQLLSDDGEEALEAFDGALLADPEQAGHSLVDLVDQRQVFVALGVLNFIHTDSSDRLQLAMLQTPADHVLDGIADLVPRSMERLGGFLPGEFPRPAGQEEHVGFGGLVLAIAPRHLLDHHATIPALDAPHAVQKENQDSPERNELKTPLRKTIVTGRGLVAPRADRRRARARPDVHFDAFLIRGPAGESVDKSRMTIAVV